MRQADCRACITAGGEQWGSRLPAPFQDHVQRQFVADQPDKLWVTESLSTARARDGFLRCLIHVFSRRCVGSSIATICAPSLSSTRSIWLASSVVPGHRAGTPTAELSSPRGCSERACARQDSWARWENLPRHMTTR